MSKVKFTVDQGTAFYRELQTKVEARLKAQEKSKFGGKVFAQKAAMYFSLNVILYLLMISSTSAFFFHLWYLLVGLSVLLTTFNVAHDAAHGIGVKSPKWNKRLLFICFRFQGINAAAWKKNHVNSHHIFTNISGEDLDLIENPLMRLSAGQQLKFWHKYQHLYMPLLTLLYSLNSYLFRDITVFFKAWKNGNLKDYSIWGSTKLLIAKGFYLNIWLWIPLYFCPVSLGSLITGLLINHFIASLIFVYALGVAHASDYVERPKAEKGNIVPMSWPSLQMNTTIDYNASSKFLNWTLGGFNTHAIHHLLPGVSHVHYVDLLPIFTELAEKHNMTYMNMSYSKAISSYFRFFYKMGREEDPGIKAFNHSGVV